MNSNPFPSGTDGMGENYFSPANAEELQETLKTASKLKRPVFAYRSPKPQDAARIDLKNLNRILEIDPTNLVTTVEPYVKFGELSKALCRKGLRFVPADTPFFQEKSVGEFFYEGLPNIGSLKYGAAKHFLMGSEIVLPNGETLKTGGKTVKNVTGYDMTRFMNSSFANFGITVKFLLKIHPAQETRKVVITSFSDFSTAYGFVDDLRSLKIVPVYLVWADEQSQLIANLKESDRGAHLLLFELDGVQEEVEHHWFIVSDLLAKRKAVSAMILNNEPPEEKRISALYTPNKGFVLIDEFKIRYSDQPKFIQRIETEIREKGIVSGLFGQIAEGKLCVCIEDDIERLIDFVKQLSGIATKMNGFSSGRLLRALGLAPTGPLAKIEDQLKALYDPEGILKG